MWTSRVETMRRHKGGNVGVGTMSPDYPLKMGSGAHVTVGGTWTNASSRQENIEELPAADAIEILEQLRPVPFNYLPPS